MYYKKLEFKEDIIQEGNYQIFKILKSKVLNKIFKLKQSIHNINLFFPKI